MLPQRVVNNGEEGSNSRESPRSVNAMIGVIRLSSEDGVFGLDGSGVSSSAR